MTLPAFLKLLQKNSAYLLLGALLGGLTGFITQLNPQPTYEARTFVSIGTNWKNPASGTPAWDSTQATENFAETMIGIIKAGNFHDLLHATPELSAVSCGAQTYEKGNLLISCQTSSADLAALASDKTLTSLSQIIKDYNTQTGNTYALGNSRLETISGTPSSNKSILSGVTLGFLLALALVLVFRIRQNKFWHSSQVEEILGRRLPEINPSILTSLAKTHWIAFLGDKPAAYSSALSLPQDLDKLNPEKHLIIINLNSAKQKDLLLLLALHPQLKIFTYNNQN